MPRAVLSCPIFSSTSRTVEAPTGIELSVKSANYLEASHVRDRSCLVCDSACDEKPPSFIGKTLALIPVTSASSWKPSQLHVLKTALKGYKEYSEMAPAYLSEL